MREILTIIVMCLVVAAIIVAVVWYFMDEERHGISIEAHWIPSTKKWAVRRTRSSLLVRQWYIELPKEATFEDIAKEFKKQYEEENITKKGIVK